MKNLTRSLRPIAWAVALSIGLTGAAAASTKFVLGSSTDIPAAQGYLKVKDTNNGNVELRLSVKHLAPPGRVVPGASVFVVWVRGLAAGTDAQNLGTLKVNSNLSGRFRSVTPMQSFDMFMTCEQSATVLYPSGPQLLPVHFQHK